MIDHEIATNIAIILMTLERLAIVVCIAFIWTRLPLFRSFQDTLNPFDTKLIIKLILVFSAFGIIGTLAGVVIDIGNITYEPFTYRVYKLLESPDFLNEIIFTKDEAIINFRVMILVVAGLLGGPIVGLFSGIIVGIQRWSLGGFSDLINLSSSISVGLIAGIFFYLLTPEQRRSPYIVMLICFFMELLRRAYLIYFSGEGQGELLMKYIALPMIIGNSFGGFIFMKVIEVVNKERQLPLEKIRRLNAEYDKEKAEKIRKHEEIKSLLLYMVPHFLNSSLTDIIAKVSSAPDSAEKILYALAHFTRKSLQNINRWSEGKSLRIEDEVEQIKDYLFIMKEQEPTLNFIQNYDQNLLHFKCSLFVLQPLVENAINYGCKYKDMNNLISISITDRGDKICLSVEDNGIGMPEYVKHKLGNQEITTTTQGTGKAFLNVIQRLQKIFNHGVEYTIVSEQNKGTLITLLIPKEEIEYDE